MNKLKTLKLRFETAATLLNSKCYLGKEAISPQKCLSKLQADRFSIIVFPMSHAKLLKIFGGENSTVVKGISKDLNNY